MTAARWTAARWTAALSLAAVWVVVLGAVAPAVMAKAARAQPAAMARPAACLTPPVAGPIVVPYRQPSCPYCSGHRGVEYHPAPGAAVHAVAGGVVTFAGVVVGTRYVVIAHADGMLATYGLLASSPLRRGQWVAAETVVGASTARLYFGLRRDGAPVDPTPLLSGGRPRARLVPTDGAAPLRRPTRTCAAAAASR